MPIAVNQFWKLAVASGLLTPSRCQELHLAFKNLKGAARQANTHSLAEWLVAEGNLSRYQALQLLAGRGGPFVFGEFTIFDRISSGRLSNWFRARSRGDQNALILFAAQFTSDENDFETIEECARAAMAVQNPHVTRALRFVPAHPPFVVVEDLAGQSLREQLAGQRCTAEIACRIAFHAALGLVALHERKLVHGALWPENLWIEPSGAAKIMQFPLVTAAGRGQPADVPAIDYLAPELHDSRRTSDVLSDIYSLGCTLYELVAGRVPFPGGTVQQKMRRHRSELAQRLDLVLPGVPEELADLVAEMIDKEPALRCQTASHVAHLLAPFAAGSTPWQARPPQDEARKLTPGYGAWQAPSWQAPPRPAAPPRPRSDPPADKPESSRAPTVVIPTLAQREKIQPGHVSATATDGAKNWEPPFVVRDATPAATAKLAKNRLSDARLLGIAAATGLAIAILIAGFVFWRAPSDEASPHAATRDDSGREKPAPQDRATRHDEAPPPTKLEASETLVEDDGQTLWTSPTAGAPPALDYLPPDAQVILILRPAALMASPEGPKLLGALGPKGETVASELRSTLGAEWSQIDQLSIALFADETASLQTAFTMRLALSVSEAELLAAWGNPTPVERGSKKLFTGRRWAYTINPGPSGTLVAIARQATMNELVDIDGRPPLGKGIERLLADSDSTRHVNLLLSSSTLFTGGKELLSGDLKKLHDPLSRMFDESIEAVLASAHVGEQLFLELRAVVRPQRQPSDSAAYLRDRLELARRQVTAYVERLHSEPHGRQIVERLPEMMRLLCEYTRAGAENRQAVLRCYLPSAAAHNLLLAGRLALSEDPAVAEAREAARPQHPVRAAAAAALKKTVSLSFPRETFERSLELLAQEIGVNVVILGTDLQLEGITRNQSLALDERDRPAGDVLLRILQLADPSARLAYVIRPADDGTDKIVITTRSAASRRGEALAH